MARLHQCLCLSLGMPLGLPIGSKQLQHQQVCTWQALRVDAAADLSDDLHHFSTAVLIISLGGGGVQLEEGPSIS